MIATGSLSVRTQSLYDSNWVTVYEDTVLVTTGPLSVRIQSLYDNNWVTVCEDTVLV